MESSSACILLENLSRLEQASSRPQARDKPRKAELNLAVNQSALPRRVLCGWRICIRAADVALHANGEAEIQSPSGSEAEACKRSGIGHYGDPAAREVRVCIADDLPLGIENAA